LLAAFVSADAEANFHQGNDRSFSLEYKGARRWTFCSNFVAGTHSRWFFTRHIAKMKKGQVASSWKAKVKSTGRKGELLESIGTRLSLEPGVTTIRWEIASTLETGDDHIAGGGPNSFEDAQAELASFEIPGCGRWTFSTRRGAVIYSVSCRGSNFLLP
jgi:hypothetical protein